jgi:hypothetical protein
MKRSSYLLSLLVLAAFACVLCCAGCTETRINANPPSPKSGLTVASAKGKVGSTIDIPVTLENASPIRAAQITLTFNSAIVGPGDSPATGSIHETTATPGSTLASRWKWSGNTVTLYFASLNPGKTVATIPFKAKAKGATDLSPSTITAYGADLQTRSIETRGGGGSVTVTE